MEPEIFDYDDEEDSSRQNNNTPSELGDIFGPPDADQPRTPARTNAGLDMRVMAQVVVAVILLVVAGGLLARDAWSRRARDTAFHQVIEANSQRDYLRVIQAAESFLTHQSVNGGRDAREDGVVSLYSEALVHWVAQQPGQLDANAHARVARYKQLVKSPAK